MKALFDIVEGLLNPRFEIEDTASDPVVKYIIDTWRGLRFAKGSSHIYKPCWVNAGNFEKTRVAIIDFERKFHTVASKNEITPREAERMASDRDDVVIICFSYDGDPQNGLIGIGNPAKDDALEINKSSYGPYGANPMDYYDMVTVYDPSFSTTHKKPDATGVMLQSTYGKYKKVFYALPGHYWEQIKSSICS